MADRLPISRSSDWGSYYLSTILDGYSRYIIAWKLCTNMTADDVTATLAVGARSLQAAIAANVVHKPKLLGDYGSPYVSGDLAEWLEDHGMDHVRTCTVSPANPGQDRALHQTLKNLLLLENHYLPGDQLKTKIRDHGGSPPATDLLPGEHL